MKWRNALVYLAVLLLIGGYYCYFEVIQKKQKEMAATEARKVFHFQADKVSALTVKPKGKETIQLEKEGQWEVVDPIRTDADKFSVNDLINALSRLEAEREVTASADDLKPFGLQEPALTISFLAGERAFELLIGDKNPVGDGSYAKTPDKSRVFLIAEGSRSILGRGLNELRRRQLFTFQLDDVVAVNVVWRDGKAIRVDLAPDEKAWKCPDDPQVKIKKSKMDNVIEQIHWLSAQNFLENKPSNLPAHGLEPPDVTVSMRLKSDENVELRLAKKEKDEKQVAALSSQLPSVVQVAASVLDDLPKDLEALQDRSLLGYKSDEIKQVKWSFGDSQSDVVQLDESRWGLKKGEKNPEPIKDSWRVKSLLWDLGDAEYQKKLDPAPPVAPKPYCRIELWNAEKSLMTLSWEKPPQEGREPVPVWVERDGGTAAVSVDAEALRRVTEDVERLRDSERHSDDKQ